MPHTPWPGAAAGSSSGDGSSRTVPPVTKTKPETTFTQPGAYVATLWVKDNEGNEDVDFCQIKVFSKSKAEANMPHLFMSYTPTEGIRPGPRLSSVMVPRRKWRPDQPGLRRRHAHLRLPAVCRVAAQLRRRRECISSPRSARLPAIQSPRRLRSSWVRHRRRWASFALKGTAPDYRRVISIWCGPFCEAAKKGLPGFAVELELPHAGAVALDDDAQLGVAVLHIVEHELLEPLRHYRRETALRPRQSPCRTGRDISWKESPKRSTAGAASRPACRLPGGRAP